MQYKKKKYCSAVFLDVQEAFDKVWHEGLLFKIKQKLQQYFLLLKSYLSDRSFQVRHGQDLSELHPIQSGVPQSSVLGPVLYTLFTADLPIRRNIAAATFADDTAILAVHQNPKAASKNLQRLK